MSLKILVCVQAVYEPQETLSVDTSSLTAFSANSQPVRSMNPADRCALEEAMHLKAECEAQVTSLALGGEDAEAVLAYSLGRGVDAACHLQHPAAETPSLWQAVGLLAEKIAHLQPDLILCGQSSLDWGSTAIGPFLAELLDLPQVTRVASLQVDPNGRTLRAERQMERGGRQPVACNLPAVICVTERINQPAYVSVYRTKLAADQLVQREQVRLPIVAGIACAHLVELGAVRPRPRRLAQPSANLTAAQRIQFLMSGGQAKKANASNLFEGPLEEAVERVIGLLKERGLL